MNMAVAFANIFMAKIEKENTHTKLHVCYMYIHLLEYRFFFAQKNQTTPKKVLQPFVMQYHAVLPNLQDTLMGNDLL